MGAQYRPSEDTQGSTSRLIDGVSKDARALTMRCKRCSYGLSTNSSILARHSVAFFLKAAPGAQSGRYLTTVQLSKNSNPNRGSIAEGLTEWENIDRPDTATGGDTVGKDINTLFCQRQVLVVFRSNTISVNDVQDKGTGIPRGSKSGK